MARQLRVAIVGYGIGGIAAAIHLRRRGHRIAHFDRNDPPIGAGAGMLLHPPALRHLRKLGILDKALDRGSPVRRIRGQTLRGQLLMDMGYAELAADQHGLGIQRETLHELLSSADTGRNLVLCGHNVTGLDPRAGYLFQDGDHRHGPYDLIVVADGAHSILREQIPVFARRNQRSGTAALVGLLDDPGGFASDRLVQYFDGTRHLAVWPVGSDSPGGPLRCAIAMNVSYAEGSAVGDQERWHNHMIHLCPPIGGLLKRGSSSSLYVFTYRDVELSTYSVGRTVLLGDAAHSMSPQLGVGAQLAMEDAEILAIRLDECDDLTVALQGYSKTRPIQLSRYQQASRWLTPMFQSDNRLLAGIRDRVLASTVHAPIARRLAQELLC